MGAVFNDGNLLLTKPIRGWGLPGGHIEDNVSPEECLKRECIEEGDVEIGNLKLIGYWKIKKLKKVESNKKYPDEGYQLLYIAGRKRPKKLLRPKNPLYTKPRRGFPGHMLPPPIV